ncbi:MAG: hypothetical protein J6I76_21585 [Oribacterium sp.]|nr:hypothetical protein [Oribacterium sp.]
MLFFTDISEPDGKVPGALFVKADSSHKEELELMINTNIYGTTREGKNI